MSDDYEMKVLDEAVAKLLRDPNSKTSQALRSGKPSIQRLNICQKVTCLGRTKCVCPDEPWKDQP